jgi:hypothetical protein
MAGSGTNDGMTRRRLLASMAAGAAAIQARWLLGERAWAEDAAQGWLCELEGRTTGGTDVRAAPRAPAAPEEIGQWSPSIPGPFRGVEGVHAVVLHTGWVLLLRGLDAFVWDPVTGNATRMNPPEDLFCAGQTVLGGGDVLFAGGKAGAAPLGATYLYTFRPSTASWVVRPDLARGRFYPTTTTLPDGRAIITSGLAGDGVTINDDVELYDTGTLTIVASQLIDIYPKQFVLPDGRILVAGPERKDTFILDPVDWSADDIHNLDAKHHNGPGLPLPGGPSGSTRVMLIGGNGTRTSSTSTPIARCEVFDAAHPSDGWVDVAPLPEPRSWANAVLLPDGTALCVGGGNRNGPTKMTLLYDPAPDTWTPLAAQAEARQYHSTAVLLPDGRVLSAGDTTTGGGGDRLEVYSPAYLFRGPRPVIADAPTQVRWGESFNVPTPDVVARVVFMRTCATTHALDMNQRHVELAFTAGSGRVTAVAPPSGGVAPVGYYLLFLLSPDGVPSIGRFVRIIP